LKDEQCSDEKQREGRKIHQERRRDGGPSDRDVPELSPENSCHVKNLDRRSDSRESPWLAETLTSPQRRPTRDEGHGVARGRRRAPFWVYISFASVACTYEPRVVEKLLLKVEV
jgi:hypothetical protein